jgi:transcriptional regulator with XRE-family HTH domain
MNKEEKLNHIDLLDKLMSEITPKEQARTDQRMLLAAKIDDARIAQDLSKGEFANLMGKKPSEISRWLSGTHNFTSDTLSDIQEVLGIRLLDTELKEKQEVKVVFYTAVSGTATLNPKKVISLYNNSTPCKSLQWDC